MENGPVRDMASCNLDLHEINKAIIGRDRDASHARREVKLHHPLCSFLQVVIVGHDNSTTTTTTTTTLAQPPHRAYQHPWRPNTTMKSKLASTTPPTMTSRLRSRLHKKKTEKKKKIPKNPSRFTSNPRPSIQYQQIKCVLQAKLDPEFQIGESMVSFLQPNNFPPADQKVESLERKRGREKIIRWC